MALDTDPASRENRLRYNIIGDTYMRLKEMVAETSVRSISPA